MDARGNWGNAVVKLKVYVEGGGDSKALKTECRQGFSEFITNSGVTKRPRVVACGSRRDAYDSFCTAVRTGEAAMLLVDSEEAVDSHCQTGQPSSWRPWQHLKQRQGDGWDRPDGAVDTACHLMVQVMESWFLTDRSTLSAFFGQGFNENALPAAANAIEHIAKAAVEDGLDNATRRCKTKARYSKGEHSFKLLARIDARKVIAASPWAKRFVDELTGRMGP